MNYVHNNDAYCTHQKYTIAELEKLKKNSIVIELGVGNGSSPLMYDYCKNNPDSTVISFETDLDWFNTIFNKYGDLPNYNFNYIQSWDNLNLILNALNHNEYNLVFVDQSPWDARIKSIDLLKNKCDTFILHDYDYYNKSENEWVKNSPNSIYVNDETTWLGQIYSSEFFLEDYYEILPPTLIMRKK